LLWIECTENGGTPTHLWGPEEGLDGFMGGLSMQARPPLGPNSWGPAVARLVANRSICFSMTVQSGVTQDH
jgi:hypothetical protein